MRLRQVAKILVTGATGFIGRHLMRALLRRDYAIVLLTRQQQAAIALWGEYANAKIVSGCDLERDGVSIVGDEAPDSIVHLAGLAHTGQSDRANVDDAFRKANVVVTRRLVEAALLGKVRKFIFLSSLASITSNVAAEPIDDDTKAVPNTAYGLSKREAERYVETMATVGRFAISLRPPLVVGSDARGNWNNLQRLAATGWPLPFASIRNERSFISVQSLVDAIVLLCSRNWPAEASGAYALADPMPIALPDVITELRAGMDLPPRLFTCPPAAFDLAGSLAGRSRQIAGLTGSLRVDASRFFSTFGFQPTLPLREAIRLSGRDYLVASRHGHSAPRSGT